MIGYSPNLPDPLAQIVTLLRPSAALSKLVIAGGAWTVRRSDRGQPFYCAMLEGSCRLLVAGEPLVTLDSGDFVLVPAAHDFATSSAVPPPPGTIPDRLEISPGVFRLGDPDAPADVRMLIGHCTFGSDDAQLLAPLLPRLVHIRGERRLTSLVELIDDEARADRPGREPILARLVEVLLIEALRSTSGPSMAPGLLRGLHDERLAVALRRMHDRPDQAWTVADLAHEAALSRSTFFDRFRREIGVAPMEYLLGWRMALAKDMLRSGGVELGRVAARIGYSSASTFSTAFSRHVGRSPGRYARECQPVPTLGVHASA